MNLANARIAAKRYALESKAGQFTDSDWDALLIEANNQVYHECVATNPDRFLHTQQVSYTADAASLNLTSALTHDFVTLNAVWRMPKAGAVSRTNRPEYVEPVNHVSDLYNEVSDPRYNSNETTSFRFFVASNLLHISPIPSSALNLTLYYVPVPFEPTVDVDLLLSFNNTVALFPRHHETIVLLAVLRAIAIVEDDPAQFVGIYNARRRAFMDAVGMDQQNQEPSQIRRGF